MSSIEWLVTEHCNYNCEYCGLVNNDLTPTSNEDELEKFLKKIKLIQDIKGLEFFLFGGEPFLHPKIEFIINKIIELGIVYRFQTNLSKASVNKIIELYNKGIILKNVNVSVHPKQQALEKYIEHIKKLKDKVVFGNIEIMYDGRERVQDYYELVKTFPDLKIMLCPVSDFLVEGFNYILKDFNALRKEELLKPLKKRIRLEEENMKHPITGKRVFRSEIWEEFAFKKWSPKGKECLIKNNFFMYDSKLNTFNCCFHDFVDQENCPYDTCFLA